MTITFHLISRRKKVMLNLWFVVAFAIWISKVYCQNSSFGATVKNDGGLVLQDSIFGFKPCLDENCENYAPSLPEPKDPASEAEKPMAHCMVLKQSAVKQFKEFENAHPDIKDIKYGVLEEMIEYIHSFTSLQAENCQPAMKLIDLVILAANALRTQYMHQGAEECIYEKHGAKTDTPIESEKATDVPCKPDYSEDIMGIPVCDGKKELEKPTEKPYGHQTEKKVADQPYVPASTYKYEVTCPDGASSETPCAQSSSTVTEEYFIEETEIIEEENENINHPHVGSLRGIPGVHYPNYTDIPITSFTCAEKYIPGFYADLEAGCQVFHVCYEHRRESFLCPVGTIFNQPILACDYWYSSNCSLSSYYYKVNEQSKLHENKIDVEVEELLTEIAESDKTKDSGSEQHLVESDLDKITHFFPVKAVVTELKPEVKVPIRSDTNAEDVASSIVDTMATTATKVLSGTRHYVKSIPEPAYKPAEPSYIPVSKKPLKMNDLLKGVLVPLVTAKLAAVPVSKVTAFKKAVPIVSLASKTKAAIPVAAKAKLATKAAIPVAKAAAIPVLVKAKVAAAALPAAKAVVPAIVKAKIASAAIPAAKVAVSAPVAKGKMIVPAFKIASAKVAASSIPALKAKTIASAVPLVKTKLPLMKAKAVKSAGTPLLKAKMLALPLTKSKVAGPLFKAKLAKAAAISPLTKKALALGYIKLLKAKKFALMG